MFLELIRPDIINVLENENVKKALPRYRKILLKKEKAKFHLVDLKEKVKQAYEILKSCELCERKCKVNRAKGELGECRVGNEPIISSAFVHMGEEPMIVPSFTIFFMGCTFHCQYCQNYSISQWYERGRIVDVKELAKMIDEHKDCRNVNFVGGEPTPQLPFILDCLQYVKSNIPIVWNSNFYMSLKSMNLLKNIVDIYLTDWKYWNNKCAEKLSKVKNYLEIIKRNHDLAFKDSEMIIRHLILPDHFECCTKPILEYIAENYGKKVIVNIMDQYYPSWKAHEYQEISRRLTSKEFQNVVRYAKDLNLIFIT
ncbi:MAG: radical SAM protein [Candidatus Aenigmatarchaeota archaeon]